jgi:hypothetical protein
MMQDMPRKAKHQWHTLRLVGFGELVGLLMAIMHNFYDAFWSEYSDEDLFAYLMTRVVVYVLAGALVLGVISAIRNWLVQDR